MNGSFYVGSAVDTRVRFQAHRRSLRKGNHHCQHLQRAWNKHGEDCFKFEIVEPVVERSDLLLVEDRWLAEHHGKPHCYNVGRNTLVPFMGLVHTDEAKEKMSLANKGMRYRLGHTNDPEHRRKISEAMRGKKKSPEHVEKMRQRMMGTSYAKGRVVTEEMRAAIGRPVVEVTQGATFISIVAAAEHYGLGRPNLIRALRTDAPLKRGPCAGLHFRYLEKHALPKAEE